MFGWINDCTEKLVITKFGIDAWHSIKEKADCAVVDGGFVRHEYYPDESTVKLVVAASELLGLTVDQVLEAFGTFFMEFVRAEGFDNLLQCQGNTLQSWLSNMNALHDHLQSSLPPGMVAPVFWCESDDANEGSMILHYYSKRGSLLVPLVVGVVKEVARYHFDVAIDMVMLTKQDEDGASHTSWTIKAADPEEAWKITLQESKLIPKASSSQAEPTVRRCPFSGMTLPSPDVAVDAARGAENVESKDSIPVQVAASSACPVAVNDETNVDAKPATPKEPCISSRNMKKIFPYHIVINETFDIIQIGNSLPPLMGQTEEDLLGKKIADVLIISRPVLGAWEWQSLRKLEDQTFFVDPIDQTLVHVKFKANTVVVSDPGEAYQVMLVLSPDVKNVKELRCMKLTMSDLPLHSFQRDAVFLGEHIASEVKSSLKLDHLSKKLRHEQHLSKVLLHSMLPPHVANELRAGKLVEPELHENVTLFFSDIVGFTNICEDIFPWDCVDLLNRLYCVMDYLSAKFDLYKVETIGDSYLCASGLPNADPEHARKVANFAIACMHCCQLVMNPSTGEPIQLRIGIHSGACMTGVVGMKTPHYCVFGDTVNTASRHESTSVAGKIQCSSITYGLLKHFSPKQEFEFVSRGLVDMKGKGLMATYFLEYATNDNPDVNPEALDVILNEVDELLRARSFSKKRYFKHYGRRDSETYFRGSITGSSTSDTSQPDLDVDEFLQ